MITSTPLYDALLAEAFDRARASEHAASLAAAALHLHVAGPAGHPALCLGCGLPAPCPTADLLLGTSSVQAALVAVAAGLDSRQQAHRSELDQAVAAVQAAAVQVATAQAAAVQVAAAQSAAVQAAAAVPVADPLDADSQDLADEVRSLPAMPSAAEIFAPNPAFSRTLSLLFGDKD